MWYQVERSMWCSGFDGCDFNGCFYFVNFIVWYMLELRTISRVRVKEEEEILISPWEDYLKQSSQMKRGRPPLYNKEISHISHSQSTSIPIPWVYCKHLYTACSSVNSLAFAIKKITVDCLCMVAVNVPAVYDMVLIFFNITPVSA